jgi:hypothetical protein
VSTGEGTSNYAFKRTAEQALRSKQTVAPQPLNAALEALLSSTTSGAGLAGVRQRQHPTMHIIDANLYKVHYGLMPRLILI